jgi:ABC-type uncharacterized transport system substrate-binding protein
MQRREFIVFLGSAAVASSFATFAQPVKLRTVGVLGGATAATWSPWVAAFIKRLAELGWVEGRTVAFEYRWAAGSLDRAAEFANEFVRLKVDVILTAGGVLAAVKPVTSVTPVVFATATDPVETGFVASLARPGGNLTGLSNQAADHAAKRVELLRELLPAGRKLAVLLNSNNRGAVLEVYEVERAARTFGFQSSTFEIQQAEDIVSAFEAIKGRADALYVCTDVLMNVHRRLINTLALSARLPTIHSVRDYVEAGGLMSYGTSIVDSFRLAAEYVDKILRGAAPGDLPIQQPTKFDLVINITTAKALGITVPPTLLSRADEVIE